jgi:hypothetical protein
MHIEWNIFFILIRLQITLVMKCWSLWSVHHTCAQYDCFQHQYVLLNLMSAVHVWWYVINANYQGAKESWFIVRVVLLLFAFTWPLPRKAAYHWTVEVTSAPSCWEGCICDSSGHMWRLTTPVTHVILLFLLNVKSVFIDKFLPSQ